MRAQVWPGIQQLELLPADEVAALLRSRPEDQWFDRVSIRIEPRAVGERLVGFANAEGGMLVIGIHDGEIEAVDGVPRLVNEWRQAAVNFTEPPVRHEFRLLATTAGQVALLEVEPSETVHETTRGETFLRIGDENRRLGASEAQELRFDKGQSVFDGRAAPGAGLEDLDEDLIRRLMQRIPGARRQEVVLEARGLLTRRDDRLVPTVAGLLVLGREPQRVFPEAFLRLVRYEGSVRGTGARSNVRRDVRIDGPLSAQIAAARRYIRRWLPSVIRLRREGTFGRSGIIPEAAWLEAIVNAVVHRSYSMAGDHVRVELFDDRLEVESPGRLPGLVRVDTIRSTRFARNPRVARAIADLGFGRELGEGVDRMFEEMERAGLPAPIYVEAPASLRVAFLVESRFAQILRELPPGSERFVEWMSRMGSVTTTQAVELFGRSRPLVLERLKGLAARGLVEHVGSSAKDPRGHWRLAMPKEPSLEGGAPKQRTSGDG